MTHVIVYSKAQCPYCDLAKALLARKNVSFEEIRIDLLPEKRDEMIALSQRRTVPQIFIDGKSIGGYDDLAVLAQSGELDKLLHP